MLDKPEKTFDLIAAMRAAVPFEVELTPPLLARLRSDTFASEIAPRQLVVSLTHLQICRTLPFEEGKGVIRWTRLSCRSFAANAVRPQLHALAYNLGNFLRTLATPEPIEGWSLTSLREKLIKIGAKVVGHR